MLIRDIILAEGYADDLLHIVQDTLVMMMGDDIGEIPTDKFKAMLAQQGYIVSTEEIIAAVDASGFASSVDANSIIPTSELPSNIGQDTEEEPVDVGAMAGDQAMKDINQDLPQ